MQYKLLVSIFWSKRLVTCFVLNTVDGICVITLLVFMHLFDGPCCSSFKFFCFFLLCVFTFCISCDVSYDFRIKTMFGSSLPPVVYRRDNVLFMLFVLEIGITDILCCVFLRPVVCTLCSMLLCIVHFWLPLPYSLSFIISIWEIICLWIKYYEYLSSAD